MDSHIPTTAPCTPLSPRVARKQHRRWPSASSRSNRRAGKPSPSTRPQTRKKPSLNINSRDVINGLHQENGTPTSAGPRRGGNEGSSQDSISPEPLSEPLMPPPAIPQPKKSASATKPQAPTSIVAREAATPATLMRIQKSQQNDRDPTGQCNDQAQVTQHDDVMEDVVLPEAATPTTTNIQLESNKRGTDTSARITAFSPAVSASATPSIEPVSGTLDKTPTTVAPSPSVTNATTSPAIVPASKTRETKSGNSRKRQSISSTQNSPALKPKISPNIKPMLSNDSKSLELCCISDSALIRGFFLFR